MDIALDTSGNVYVTDTGYSTIRKITVSTGIISILAGGGSSTAFGVAATSFSFNQVVGVAVDTAGNVYAAEIFSDRIVKVDTTGILSLFAGLFFFSMLLIIHTHNVLALILCS